MILAGTEKGETPRNTIHHETWEVISISFSPWRGTDSAFQSSPTANNRATWLNPNPILVLLGFPEHFKRGIKDMLFYFQFGLHYPLYLPGQAPGPFTVVGRRGSVHIFSPFSPLQNTYTVQNYPFYFWFTQGVFTRSATWPKKIVLEYNVSFDNFKTLRQQSQCSDLKWSLWEWKVLIDLYYFSSTCIWGLPLLTCNTNLNELCEQWWNLVHYLPHQVINDFINKTDNKTVITSTLLWKMILASRSIFQGPGFSVAAPSPFNIFHRQRKVKIHFETNFN